MSSENFNLHIEGLDEDEVVFVMESLDPATSGGRIKVDIYRKEKKEKMSSEE